MSNTNNQFSFLDYTGLSLFWSKVKKIISDNESATTTSLNNLDTRVNTLETKVADQTIPLSVGSVSTAVQQDASTASGEYSFAEGYYTNASNTSSHAEGIRTVASGQASHAEGGFTEAKNRAEHAEGMFNISIQDKTIHTVGIGVSGDNKNAHEIHVDGKHYIFGIGGYDGTNSQTAGIKTVQEVISDIQDKLIKISYNDLVTLRNSSKLVPGQQYRIIDYTCTTLEANTQSAGHVFDIIVTADSENKLNEEARAIQHTEDDTDYFANSNLSAWKIWYCLDNDTNRFKWASKAGQYIQFMNNGIYFNAIYMGSKVIDNTTYYLWHNEEFSYQYGGDEYYYIGTTTMSPTSGDYYDIIFDDGDPYIDNNMYSDGLSRIDIAEDGKGVIFRMIDEFNNDIPYDFKNIQFKHPHDTTTYPYYYYTFSSNNNKLNNTDYSLSISNDCYLNTIKPYIYGPLSIQYINKILFIGSNCYGNSFGNNCHDNSFLYNCNDNSFGNNCRFNKFGSGCCTNSFGSDCPSNSFGNNCNRNTFGNNCGSNSFGNSCSYNSFGNYCINNKFGQYCMSNSFGNSCSYNEFGLTTISSYTTDNFSENSFGNSCLHNVFGNYCVSNSFGNYCIYIKFASTISAATKYTYYKNNHFGDGCQYILFTGTETASSSQQVQNYNFAQGLQGTSSAYLTIPGLRNKAFDITISKDSSGNVYSYCLANVARQLGANLIS